MANALNVTETLTDPNSNRNYGVPFAIARTGESTFTVKKQFGTTEETVTLPTWSNGLGTILFRNYDLTNKVLVGWVTGVANAFIEVPPGVTLRCYGPTTKTAMFVAAVTAACEFEINAFEA